MKVRKTFAALVAIAVVAGMGMVLLFSTLPVAVAADGPDAPTDDRPYQVTATATSGAIVLTWEEPDNFYGPDYHILRHRPELGESEPLVYVDFTGSSDTTFTDTDVEPGVLYVYRVRATIDFLSSLGEASDAVQIRMPVEDPSTPQDPNTPATGTPTISGTAQVSQTLTVDTSGIADVDGVDNASFSYQWVSNDGDTDSDIQDATSSTYTVRLPDAGKSIKVRVSFTDDTGNEESVVSDATSEVPAIWSGTVTVGNGPEGSGAMGFSAFASGTGSITSPTFEFEGVPNRISVVVYTQSGLMLGFQDELLTAFALHIGADTFRSEQASMQEGTSAFIHTWSDHGLSWTEGDEFLVVLLDTAATGAPTISGTALVGQTLTASTAGIADTDGLDNVSYSYQWIRSDGSSDTDIQGATGSSYTLVDDDEGKTIKVKVTFSDDAGHEETLTSTATAAVAAPTQADSEDEPSLRSYITVVVAVDTSDPDNTPTDFTITWSDVDACSTGYNAYFSNDMDVTRGRDATHLGSAAADGSQITSSLSTVEGEGIIFLVELYCAGRLVSRVSIPHDDGPSSEESNRRLVPSTYSSEPPLTALTVSPGTLTPTFHNHTPSYTVADVVSADDRLTLVATAKPGYGVVFVKDAIVGFITCSPWGFSCSGWEYQDENHNRVYPLTDADANVPGFQVDLAVGEELYMHVLREYRGKPLEHESYGLTVTRASNSPATGAPTISGTAQVGETLTAETSDINDDDGLDNVAYTYQWLSSRDTEIQGATDSTYTLVNDDEGKTIKVKVSFTDDANNQESLTSEPTAAVAASVPGAPEHLNVSAHDTGALDLYWEAPTGDSAITGYKVQWKETAGSWDTPADVSEARVTGTKHTITGLNDGVEYTVRVIATNGMSDSPPSTEATGTPRETTEPELATATVNGATLTLTYDEALDEASEPAADAFSVAVGGLERAFDEVSVAGSTLTLTLASAATAEDTVTVSYDAPTDTAAARIRDLAGNAASSFTSQAVVNNTPPPANTPATGAPSITGTVQVGETLTADVSGIADEDGLDSATFSFQWLSSRDTEIEGATGSTYTLTDSNEGKAIKVKVTFTDDAGHEETLTSAATSEVAAAPSPLTVSLENSPASHNGTDAFSLVIRFSEQFRLSYKTLRDHAFTVTGGTVTGAVRAEKGSNIGWTITIQPNSNADVTIVLPVTTDCGTPGAICTGDGRMLSTRLELTVSGPSG